MTEEQAGLFGDSKAAAGNILTCAGIGLKNKLSVLKMAAVLILPCVEDAEDKQLHRYAAMLYRSYYGLLRLTNHLGALGAALRGDGGLERTFFDAVTSFRELTETVRHLVGNSGAQVRFESKDDRIIIYADRRRLDMLLLNLLSNSLQNAQEALEVTVSVTACPGRAVLCVSDNGAGIPGDLVTSAWNRCAEPRTLTELTGGAGMGLGLVQNIARLHGGSAVLETRPGGGTAVTVSLPVVTAAPEAPSPGEDDGGMDLLLTELSEVVGSEKYTQLYSD